MDAIAAAIPDAATERKYAWPQDTVSPPCAVVGYPEDIDFDLTYGRGADTATFPVWFIVGKVVERAARNKLSEVIAGANGIKDALDGNLGGVVQTLRVTRCRPVTLTIGGISLLAAEFSAEVIA